MRCPDNTATCKVRKIGESARTFGSPPTAAETYYRCDVHGFFKHLRDNQDTTGATRPSWSPLKVDVTELASAQKSASRKRPARPRKRKG